MPVVARVGSMSGAGETLPEEKLGGSDERASMMPDTLNTSAPSNLRRQMTVAM